jgi:hypothetical protein
MAYVSTRLDEEAYKHISARLNKNSSRRYLTIDEVFEDLKRVYADPNKMQTAMNAFTRLTQVGKYAEFHVFWNEFQRLMTEMNLFDHFLLAELKRKMSYRLQDVMSIEFNTIDDIYELARQAQLKEDHYKRIDDAKSRRRPSAAATAGTGTGAATSRTISTTTTSTSTNEKAEQIPAKTAIWNPNQFRISTPRVTPRTPNLDPTREELMKADKCFNCGEPGHLSRDCPKSKKFRVAEMNVRDDTEESRKE